MNESDRFVCVTSSAGYPGDPSDNRPGPGREYKEGRTKKRLRGTWRWPQWRGGCIPSKDLAAGGCGQQGALQRLPPGRAGGPEDGQRAGSRRGGDKCRVGVRLGGAVGGGARPPGSRTLTRAAAHAEPRVGQES